MFDEKEIRAAFDGFDKDGSGVIEVGEFKMLLAKLGEDPDAEQLQEALETLDTDKTGTISFEEFLVWWRDEES